MAEAVLVIRVTPKATDERLRLYGGTIRAWVHRPPADGEANAAIVELVAKNLGLPKSSVAILRGAKSRHKKLAISGITQEQLDALVAERLG